jgi:hypothetical protein
MVKLCLYREIPDGKHTLTERGLTSLNVDSSLYMTRAQSFSVQEMYFLAKASRFFFIFSVSRGFLAALRDGIFRTLFRRSCTNLADLSVNPVTSWISSLAVFAGYFKTYRFSRSSSVFVVALGRPETGRRPGGDDPGGSSLISALKG